MKTELYPPSRCTAKLPDNIDGNPKLIAEEKIDGSRYVLYLDCDPYERRTGNTLLSRKLSDIDSKHVDKTLQVPHITSIQYAGLEGTVLDGEIQAEDFTKTNSIMNSAPAIAHQKQEELGLVRYRVFDIMAFRGKDVRSLPLEKRRKLVLEVVKRMDNEHIVPIQWIETNLTEYFNKIVAKGGEGIVVKNINSAYGVGWAKYKKSYDVTCFISGFKEGTGKYKDGVGSIAISVWNDEGTVPTEVGFASGFDDKIRADMSANPKKYIGRPVDIFAQEISKDDRLRHPTFYRFRDDLSSHDCTMKKLKADISSAKKLRSRRAKDE